jgi:hypothetical protein
MPHYRTITSNEEPKNFSVSFWGVQWEFPLHPLPLRPVSLLDLVELFFLLNKRKFPDCESIFSVLFTAYS